MTLKEAAIMLLVLLVLIGVPTAIFQYNNARIREDILRRIDLSQRMSYARHMMFEIRAISITSGTSLNFGGAETGLVVDSVFTDVVFVHNAAEAQYFPYDIVVVWPSENHYTEGIITGIHRFLTPENIITLDGVSIRTTIFTSEDFGLAYPLTVTDLVDNWRQVNDLWWSFYCHERDSIQRTARQYPHPWTIQP